MCSPEAGALGVFLVFVESSDAPNCAVEPGGRLFSPVQSLVEGIPQRILRKGPNSLFEFESRLRIRAEATELGQGRTQPFVS